MNEKELDFIAIARLAPGSDFLIRLALSQNKKLGRESLGDATVYSYQSRNPQVPLLYIYVDANFAYLASSLATLKNSLVPGAGPAFLKTGIQESLSENTFLFARCADPEITLTAAGRNNHFQFHARTGALLSGAIPSRMGASPVLELLTNAPRILKQPSASIAIHEVDGAPVSTLLLAFQDRQRAERFKTKVENKFTDGIASESIEELQAPEVNCLRFPYRDVQRTLCVKDQLFMQTEGSIDPLALLKDAGVAAAQKRPLTLQVSFQKKAVAEYGEMADEDDWSRFPSARAFYFLSCIRDIRGGIGSGQDEISIDIE
jgi:hypothetical protein